MPIYEYRCTNCRHVFEVHHEVGGQPGPCPNCGRTGTAQRIFTSVGLIFKGSGFHTTDYRRPAGANGDAAATPSGKESTTGGAAPTGKGTGGDSPAGSGTEAATKSSP